MSLYIRIIGLVLTALCATIVPVNLTFPSMPIAYGVSVLGFQAFSFALFLWFVAVR